MEGIDCGRPRHARHQRRGRYVRHYGTEGHTRRITRQETRSVPGYGRHLLG